MIGPIQIAVVDLGSNSFHLVLAEIENSQLRIKQRIREQVQLANGLTATNELTVEAQERALKCLQKFGEYTRHLDYHQVSIVGTYTLRIARNLQDFLAKAQKHLGHPIHIVSGEEEAELIYQGVLHSTVPSDAQRLVLDIGGGSTELIIGKGDVPRLLNSLDLGCVRLAEQFFTPEVTATTWSADAFQAAYIASCNIIAPLRSQYRQLGWQECWGTSGTLDAVTQVLAAHHWGDQPGVSAEGLDQLRQYLLSHAFLDISSLRGLNAERARVFPSGLAILCAVFDVLEVEHMRYAKGGLREGMLYQLAQYHSTNPHALVMPVV